MLPKSLILIVAHTSFSHLPPDPGRANSTRGHSLHSPSKSAYITEQYFVTNTETLLSSLICTIIISITAKAVCAAFPCVCELCLGWYQRFFLMFLLILHQLSNPGTPTHTHSTNKTPISNDLNICIHFFAEVLQISCLQFQWLKPSYDTDFTAQGFGLNWFM